MNFSELAKINVSAHIEKKNGLSYLSWAWAVDQLLRHDAGATWEYREPVRFGESMMVFCTVTAFGKAMTAQLPVMNHKNQAIQNPDAFAVNVAMQRCLAKAIALHGLGLYIYAGEDLPLETPEDKQVKQEALTNEAMLAVAQIQACADLKTLGEVWAELPVDVKKLCTKAKDDKKKELQA
jgi:hypothetical protein